MPRRTPRHQRRRTTRRTYRARAVTSTAAAASATAKRRRRRNSSQQRGGAGSSSCGYSNTYAPYNYDNYTRWRGNMGDSSFFGASVPQNPMQQLGNWFEGKSSLFTPGPFDATNQNQAQYLSSSSHNLGSRPPAHTPLDQIKVKNSGVGMYGSSIETTPFANLKSNTAKSGIPFARAGGKKQRQVRRRRRRSSSRRARRTHSRRHR